MKQYAPNYYQEFSCIADRCKHSCCIGWEIDIDNDTLKSYQQVEGALGERLRRGIVRETDGAHFRLDTKERCPFLNRQNLCDLILELGEDHLCQICTDHPRFRNFFSDREELGLGLCCEAAAELILTRTEKMELLLLQEEDGEPEDEEQVFFALRQQIFESLQNRNQPLKLRLTQLCEDFDLRLPELSFGEWAKLLWNLERLDPVWTEHLERLGRLTRIEEALFTQTKWELAFEQLAVYVVYRHLAEGCYDGRITARLTFAVLTVKLIAALCAAYAQTYGAVEIKDFLEIARLFSSEIEYSEGNMEVLLSLLDT